jgi:argininosuccinate synthase
VTEHDDVVVLAYAGDLESSVALPWLAEQYQAKVATLTLDVGQGTDLNDVRDRALAIGAVRAHVLDVREEFARTAIAPALSLGIDEPRVASSVRPIVARYLAQVAAIEGTSRVAHGSHRPASETGSLERLIGQVDSSLQVLAPCRDWTLSPSGVVDFARVHGVPVAAGGVALTAVRTLWGRALAGELMADPWTHVPPEAFTLTRSVSDWLNVPATVDITFADGIPTMLNGVAMPLVELLSSLETIAGAHGIGRLDFARQGDGRPRIVEEVPAPVVLHAAMKALSAVVPAMWPKVHGTVRMTCAMGECHVEEVSV